MDSSLRQAAALLAAIGALGGGRAAAQAMPMVPSASPGGGPVMPTTPAAPMPMPGSDTPGGPMIPRTMPGMPSANATPMPMPGTTEASANKAVIHIRVTVIGVPPGPLLSFPISRDPQTGVENDLRAAQSVTAARRIVTTVVTSAEISTLDGVPATLTSSTPNPGASASAPDAGGSKAVTPAIGNAITAMPRLNVDGTVTVKLSVTRTDPTEPGTRDKPPKTWTQALEKTETFHSGDTVLLGALTPPPPGSAPLKGRPARAGVEQRLVFATVTIVPAGGSR